MDINNFKLIYVHYLYKDGDKRYNFIARNFDLWRWYCKRVGRLIVEDKIICKGWGDNFNLVVKKIIKELKQ